MKIYEFARSLQERYPDIKGKDLVKLLQENNFDVKAPQSSIEDAAIAFLLKHFNGKPEPKKEQPAPKKEEPKPEPPKETPKKGDPMKLPDKDDKSMDFLDGCWNCRTGLSDTRGNPIKVRFCFGKNGKGQITIIDRQGKTYTGRADAQMQNGRLHIDTGDATSRNSRGSFNGLRIDCSPGAGNDAMCYGRNKGDNSPWSAKFFRD